MTKIFTLASMLLMVAFTSCHRYYTSSSFEEKTMKHKKIAVLPPQLIFTGVIPKSMSAYDIEQLEENESLRFQQSLYANILKQANGRKYIMDVQLQPYNNTIALLQKNGVSIRESWSASDDDLARMLGVDAVVRTSINKDRIMSDGLSAGIDIGRRVANAVLKQPTTIGVGMNKTSQIRATCTIVSNGETLWNDAYTRESDYQTPANDIIENITGNFAKHFPYKRKA